MRNVSGSRTILNATVTRQALLLTIFGHFYLVIHLSLSASAGSLTPSGASLDHSAQAARAALNESCSALAARNGRTSGESIKNDANCFQHVLTHSSPANRKQDSTSLFGAVAMNNLLYFWRADSPDSEITPKIIAGDLTGLRDPAALTLDPLNQEAIIYDRGRPDEIRFYKLRNEGGNFAPRVGQSPLFEGIESIAVAPKKDLLFAVNGLPKVMIINRHAKKISPDPRKRDPVLAAIEGSNTELVNPVAVETDGEFLYVADAATNQILVFDIEQKGNAAPLRVIRSTHFTLAQPGQATAMVINEKGELELLGYRNDTPVLLTFPRGANGTVEPSVGRKARGLADLKKST